MIRKQIFIGTYKLLATAVLALLSEKVVPNNPSGIIIWPGVHIGYNIGVGINMGAELSVTFFNYRLYDSDCSAGLNVGYDFFLGKTYLKSNKKGRFITISGNAFNICNNNFISKLGLAKTRLKWGFEDRNKSESKSLGINFDIAYAPLKNNILIGYHFSQINNRCMGLGIIGSNIFYTGYQYPISIIK